MSNGSFNNGSANGSYSKSRTYVAITLEGSTTKLKKFTLPNEFANKLDIASVFYMSNFKANAIGFIPFEAIDEIEEVETKVIPRAKTHQVTSSQRSH